MGGRVEGLEVEGVTGGVLVNTMHQRGTADGEHLSRRDSVFASRVYSLAKESGTTPPNAPVSWIASTKINLATSPR